MIKSIFTLSVFSIISSFHAQTTANYNDVFFSNLYGSMINDTPNEKQNYHISNTNVSFNGDWGLDVKWWGGVKIRSSEGQFYLTKGGNVGIGTETPTAKLEVKIPASGNTIKAMSIDVESFGTMENLYRSTYFQVRDLGSPDLMPFIIKGSGNVGIRSF